MSEKKLSPVEHFKIESDYLRGEIAAELVDGTDAFGKSSIQLLKHHGTYQQDNRDLRGGKREPGQPRKVYSFMVRTRVPGGKLTTAQLLGELAIADELADSTLRITSRQGLQLHGVPKGNLRETIQRINQRMPRSSN
jgi:sulfite reductase (ferredoxin)